MKLATVFFGTHHFAAEMLKGLREDPLFDVQLLVTQEDKPAGRKNILTPPPTKLFATKVSIPVHQPSSLKRDTTDYTRFDLAIVAQYGKIIPEAIIQAPRYKTINTHTSLLPKYRGASPIQSALLNGETETGVTIMLMDAGMDTGPILLQEKIQIAPDETYAELEARMIPLSLEVLDEAIPAYVTGTLKLQTQEESEATYSRLLSREDGKIHWSRTTGEIYNQYRGLTPWPGVWTMWAQKRLKLLQVKPSNRQCASGTVHTERDTLFIGTQNASIEIIRLQLEGKPPMDALSFINGYRHINNAVFS